MVPERAGDLVGEKLKVKLKTKLEQSWGPTWVLDRVDARFESLWIEEKANKNSNCRATVDGRGAWYYKYDPINLEIDHFSHCIEKASEPEGWSLACPWLLPTSKELCILSCMATRCFSARGWEVSSMNLGRHVLVQAVCQKHNQTRIKWLGSWIWNTF